MKIYTRTGDKGETSFIGGRISKASDMIELVGELDELNAQLGIALANITGKSGELESLKTALRTVQKQLFSLGALVARPVMDAEDAGRERVKIDAWVSDIEKMIDSWEAGLAKLQNFILPGGKELGARLHGARAMSRRAERASVRLRQGLSIQPDGQSTYADNISTIQKYLNRLADMLFVAARVANSAEKSEEEIWSADSQQIRLGL